MLNEKMIGFLPNDSKTSLATADTCFNKLMIPTVHSEYAEFMKFMDLSAVKWQTCIWKDVNHVL